MKNKKHKGLVVNKAAEIRKAASLLASQGKTTRPKAVRELLHQRGIAVTSQQVSMALTNTEFAYRRNEPQKTNPVLASDLIKRLETLERAVVAITALLNSQKTPPQTDSMT